MTATHAAPGSPTAVSVNPLDDIADPAGSALDFPGGPATDPEGPRPRARRERWGLVGLLAATAGLYLWNLTSSGYANEFYSAAVQAGSQSWSAFLWGASDAAGSITVDKPPASLWPMALSVRLLGLSSFAILFPQVLMGVASVGLLTASVRRRFSGGAALLAGATLALTPVAALMFRFNNPDALLVLLMTAGAYAVLRAVEPPATPRGNRARTWWMVLAGAVIGFAFLTKQLQAFLVLPGFAVAFWWASPTRWGRRLLDGLAAVAALLVSAGWWVALVELIPASDRPYVGGSQTNSFLELTFGYNGLGRITGEQTGSVGGGPGGGWGQTGWTRLIDGEFGGQIAWLVPAALIFLVAGLWARRHAPRTDVARAAFVVWGSWLGVTWLTFSFMAGIFHQYYTVALAPAVAALVGMGGSVLWNRREHLWAVATLAGASLTTTAWAIVLLGRSADWQPWLRPVVGVVGLLGAAFLLGGWALGRRSVPGTTPAARSALRAGAGLAVVAALVGPAAYTAYTVSVGHGGSIVTAGPAVTSSTGGPGGGFPGGFPGGGPGGFPGGDGPGGAGFGQPPTGSRVPGQNSGGQGWTPSTGGLGGMPGGTPGQAPDGMAGEMAGGPGGLGGLLGGASVSAELTEFLQRDAEGFTWVAATVGSQNAAGYQLATEKSVMPIGGFNGSDPSPTLAEFQQYVADGEIHYFVSGGGFDGFIGGGALGGQNGGSSASSDIATWVKENFTAQDVDGVTVYDLTRPASSDMPTAPVSGGTGAE